MESPRNCRISQTRDLTLRLFPEHRVLEGRQPAGDRDRRRRRIEPIADPEISKGYPGRRESRVEIELNDGRKFEHFQPHRKGDPELPLTDEELNEKFIELAEPVICKAGAASLQKQLWDTEKLANVDYDTGAGAKRAAG